MVDFLPLQEAADIAGTLGDAFYAALRKLYSRFHWTSLVAAAALTVGVWLYMRAKDPEVARKGFFSFAFPKQVWLHRSAVLDYKFVLFDRLVFVTLISLLVILVAGGDGMAMSEAGKAAVANAAKADLGIVIAYTIVLFVVEDFFRYWAHRIMHQVPLLWQFHKVHHSAEVLVLPSQLRTHPVNGLVSLTRDLISVPLVTVLFLLVFPGKLTAMSILGVNAGRLMFNMLGAQLRHSHIWLPFPRFLSHIVISPAQHQIHHSREPQHQDKNYGFQFALWDWMFGSLYIPKGHEKFELGISAEEMARLRTVKALYLEPFRDAWRLIKERRAQAKTAAT